MIHRKRVRRIGAPAVLAILALAGVGAPRAAAQGDLVELRRAGQGPIPQTADPYVADLVGLSSTRDASYADGGYLIWRPQSEAGGARAAVLDIPYDSCGPERLETCGSAYRQAAEAKGWIWIRPSLNHPRFANFIGWRLQSYLLEVVQDVKERYPQVDPARIYVGGQSKGAVAASTLAFLYPDLFAGLIADSGAYDQGLRGSFGALAQRSPVQQGPIGTAAAPISVVGGTPSEIPWSFDQHSAMQLANDAAPHLDGHGVVQPEQLPSAFLGEAGAAFNAAGMPVAVIAGGADPLAPAPLTALPFCAWLGRLGYTARCVLYPDGGHVPSGGDIPGAYAILDWLDRQAARPARSEVGYQSADLVNPEPQDGVAWPFYDLAGALERDSMPLQAARHDRAGGLVLEDPLVYRVRLALRGDDPARWRGTVSLHGGRIVSASTVDDGVGLAGREREVPGSTSLALGRRQWAEQGDAVEPAGEGAWRFDLSTAPGSDEWDMVTLEVEAPPDAVLRIAAEGGEVRELELATLRTSAVQVGDAELPRTGDSVWGPGTLRAQVLQSHRWWWSQARLRRAEDANAATVWVRNVTGERLDLGRLGLDPGRPMTVAVEGATDFTGANTLALTGDWSGFAGSITVDGRALAASDYTLTPGELRIPLGDVHGRRVTVTVSPDGGGAPTAPALQWPSPAEGLTGGGGG